MNVSSVTKYLPSWFGSREKFLALHTVNLACYSIVLVGKLWKGFPDWLPRGANAYNRFSSLLYLDHNLRETIERIELVHLSLSERHTEAVFYNILEAANSALGIIIVTSYCLAAVSAKRFETRLHGRLKTIGTAALLVSVTCTLWRLSLVRRIAQEDTPCTMAAALACVGQSLRAEMRKAAAFDWDTIKNNLQTQLNSSQTALMQTAIFFPHQFISKRYPGTKTLAIADFVLHSYFFKKNLEFYLDERKQVRKFFARYLAPFLDLSLRVLNSGSSRRLSLSGMRSMVSTPLR